MEIADDKSTLEKLNESLNEPEVLEAYRKHHDNYRPSFLPRVLGGWLVFCGNLVYGEAPSYLKFRAVEVIARVPYQSWASAAYTLLTLYYASEASALRLSGLSEYAHLSQDNETMHVVVVSHLSKSEQKAGFIRYTFIPAVFAFFYFWWSYVLYLANPRYSYELNYLFEQHAFDQYSRFIQDNEEALKNKNVESTFLSWYGRHPENQYEFFRSVRNDELIHRNTSIEHIKN